MKTITKKFTVEASIGMEISLEELIERTGGVCCNAGHSHFVNELTEVLVKGKPVNLSDIKVRLFAEEDEATDIVSDAVRMQEFTIATPKKVAPKKKGNK
jgi:hypothetical protein